MITMDTYFTIVTYLLTAILGLCVGSFLNVVIYRVPEGLSLATPASHCPHCKHMIGARDNIPVLSYLILRGKCRHCGVHIPFRYTAVELSNAALWLLSVCLFWEVSIPFAVIVALCCSTLLCVFFIDLSHMLVFDRFVLILAALGVGATFLDPYYGWLSHVIGGLVGFLSFYAIAAIFARVRGKEGLGGGDIKLTGAMGLLLGWERLLLAVLIASVVASVLLSVLTRRDEKRGEGEREYPFAPFLSVGYAISLFFGATLINAYLSLLF